MDISRFIVWFLAIVWVCSILAAIGYGFAHMYDKEVYDTAKANNWVWRARATNDLQDMKTNLEKALVLLEPYDGNPCWIQPTPDTDIYQIKLNIQECIENCDTYSEYTNEMAYQQAVHNLQETEVELADHISGVNSWYYWSPISTLILTLWCWFWVVPFFLSIIL